MSWALRRRLIIFAVIVVVVGAVVVATYYLTAYKAPSCTDGKQNNNETGIDCGGPCPYLCTDSQSAPSVKFTLPVSPIPGRTDAIAYIDNPNPTSAASAVPYTIELYDAANSIIATASGTVDLPPASTVPVFVPNVFSGSRVAARAFLTFNFPQHVWYPYKDTRIIPRVADIAVQEGSAPRVTATAANPSAMPLTDVLFIIAVFDTNGNVIAASQTIAPSIPPQGSALLVFTWPEPFPSAVSKVEITPSVPLPPAPTQ